MSLAHLLAEAAALAGGNLCASGHDFEPVGGRVCPRNPDAMCSQTVYQCLTCGDYDYGDRGGPAFEECFGRTFPCDPSCEEAP